MHPYEALGSEAFWRSAVGELDWSEISGLWNPKFRFLRRHKVSTFGSCFAQHFGKALKAKGFSWFDAEPCPEIVSEEVARRFNYGVFSARTGNIYTASALLQWVRWAAGETAPTDEVWEKDGMFFDPFRPAIEPDGFASADELLASRGAAIEAFRRSIVEADIFVFTLGLTESWINASDGHVYAMCPGTVAGTFDDGNHKFVNQSYPEVFGDMRRALMRMRKLNQNIKVLLTVSPVPLTATASGKHVLTATTYSKSVLRAVAGALSSDRKWIDYFPSYEIITAPPFGGRFYQANKRSVALEGVDFVMSSFFSCQEARFGPTPDQRPAKTKRQPGRDQEEMDDLVCEEAMLDALR